mmetsp:Transcript_8874/g.25789  ORF Transcript_8874/g.25789 Transcript_8874/m.25789 type:complete len:696 (-) Transcript_8874:191-2278(-)|eukprot:CAMPEP_0118862636 /NCGR_PEP_ID=MMETSP1163-20130328/7757_1 /TAXON_ID=124430 /ORGANISM="Phaeomonas parva, Strain CCMP2877" /LENGTH=695 /DNA_ID=CAMNT_0006796555 /DNA_START=235 /DNA_END=2322 /DNA_ORIENTATION=+
MAESPSRARPRPSLCWHDVSYRVALPPAPRKAGACAVVGLGGLGNSWGAGPAAWKPVLSGVSGEVRGGEMIAIMGPSGSGKTTLLHVLAQRVVSVRGKAEVSGHILLNERAPDKVSRRQCAFVFQDEIMLQHLTVRDTIRFAALLRLPSSLPPEAIDAKVDEVIAELSLHRCADTLVGKPGGENRGVSGGERKRTAIAVELVSNPSMLFLDEPTSGLDAATALNLGVTLRRISAHKSDLLIVCAIHQPRLKLFELFTKLCLLRQGRMAYLGPQEEAVQRLQSAMGPEVPMPPQVSPPDWMLDVLTEIDAALLRSPNAAPAAGSPPGDAASPRAADFKDSESGAMDDAGVELLEAALDERDVFTYDFAQKLASQLESAASEGIKLEGAGAEGAAATDADLGYSFVNDSLWQFRVLFARQALQQRGEIFSHVYIFQMVSVAIIASLVWLQSEDVGDILGVLFFINIQQSFNTMNGVLKVFPPERSLMLRERDAGAYRVLPYFLAKSSSDFSSLFFFPVMYAVAIYFAVGLREGADHFFIYMALFMLAITTAQSLGLLVGAYVPDIVLANSINFVLVLLIMLFAGFYADVENISPAVAWIRYLSFMYWSYSGLVVNEFKGRELDCDFASPGEFSDNCRDSATDEERALGFNGDDVIDDMGYEDIAIWESCVVLIGMTVAFRVMAYLCIRYKLTLTGKS